MDSGYLGSLNNMSPTNDNILYEIQIQQGHVNPMTPISIQTNSSPINTNVLSPASSETSSASSVHYTNLNDVNMYSPQNYYGQQNQQIQSNYVYTPVMAPPTSSFTYAPFLEIIEQPSREFRFRYTTEMNGPHGNLMGSNHTKSNKSFPTVALRNYSTQNQTKIRCTVYQINEIGGRKRPHSHKLVIKNDKKTDPHDFEISQKDNYTAVCEGLGIIRTARKFIKDELLVKKQNELEFQTGRPVTRQELVAIQKECTEEAKTMNLNQVCLKYQALAINPQNGRWEEICKPIYSSTINDLKSAKTGLLKICRMSKDVSFASGGDEVFLFVEKVCKEDIKVRFYDDEWEDFGIFDESCVHHQYGIVLKTPKYKDGNIKAPVEVNIELLRPGDQCTSDPLPFRYKPNLKPENTRKRARRDSTEIPTTVSYHEQQVKNENKSSLNNNVSSSSDSNSIERKPAQSPGQRDEINSTVMDTVMDTEESILFTENILQLLDNLNDEFLAGGDDMKEFLNPDELCRSLFDNNAELFIGAGLAIDSGVAPRTNLTLILDKIKMLERIFKNEYEEKKMKHLIWDIIVKQSENGELLFTAIEQGDPRQIKYLLSILCKYKFVNLLSSKTELEENCLHLCVKYGKSELIRFFIGTGLNVNNCDSKGFTPLHLAVSQGYLEAVIELIQCQKEEIPNSILKMDLINDDGMSALHMASKLSQTEIVKLLVKSGAKITLKNPRTGDNILHSALNNENCSQDLIKYLIELDEKFVTEFNGSGFDSIHLATVRSLPDSIIKLMRDSIKDENYLMENLTLKDDSCSEEDSESSDREYSDNDELVGVVENQKTVGKIFDEICLNELSTILNVDEKWRNVSMLMGLEDFSSEWEKTENPARNLLNHLEQIEKPIEELSDILQVIEEHNGINCIDEMVVRKMRR